MFCPNCGSNNEVPRKFCKSCGCNLGKVSAALLEDPASAEIAMIRQKHINRILGGALFSLIIVLAILWILAFGVGQIKSDEFIPFAGVLSWIALMIFLANWGIARHLKKLDILKLNQAAPDGLREYSPRIGDDSLLEQSRRATPLSVAEQTTDLLPRAPKEAGEP